MLVFSQSGPWSVLSLDNEITLIEVKFNVIVDITVNAVDVMAWW